MNLAPSRRLVGDAQSRGVPLPFRLPSQMQEVKGPSARRGSPAEDRHGHAPQAPSPELQRMGR